MTSTDDLNHDGTSAPTPLVDNPPSRPDCVDGACLVSLFPDGQRTLSEIRKGDKVLAHDGGEATVT
eukprot:4041081-Heterocapsa_arctica.AAC.1